MRWYAREKCFIKAPSATSQNYFCKEGSWVKAKVRIIAVRLGIADMTTIKGCSMRSIREVDESEKRCSQESFAIARVSKVAD